MRQHECIDTQTVAAVFWEGFAAGSAIGALLRVGFPEESVSAVGVLTGSPPDLSDFLSSLGIPSVDTVYYNECFKDGAFLIIVHTPTPYDRSMALEVIRHHYGTFPPGSELHNASVQ